MLNLFKQKIKLEKENFSSQLPFFEKKDKTLKHFPSPTREWNNSVFLFNKNSLNTLTCTTKLVFNIIKSYFNLYNKNLEKKMRTKVLSLRLRRLSLNKFILSKGGFKHTNNKVYINLYIFNRQKANYLLTLKKWYLKTFLTLVKNPEEKVNNRLQTKNLNKKLVKRLSVIRFKGIQTAIAVNKDKYSLIKGLNTVHVNKKYDINNIKMFTEYTQDFYKNLIKKSLKKIRMYFYYKQLLYINKSKLNYTYLQYLKKYLEKIYNKNVEFNIINLKKFYLNSDILSESISAKLTKNRRKMGIYLTKLKNKVKVKKKQVYLGPFYKENEIFDSYLKKSDLQKSIVNELKYKDITGYRLEARGRLTRRFTASRAVYRHIHQGGIYDIDSSFRNLSTVLLKGNLKSNTQYTFLKSKTRIGSFGLKGWVSGN